MAQVAAPLGARLLPAAIFGLFCGAPRRHLSASVPPLFRRSVDFRPGGLRLPDAFVAPDLGGYSDYDRDAQGMDKKSRNERKREARRAVRWGMDLASFSVPQIKRILRVAALDQEVYDALMLVKRLGPDVREGKRRQFNYIGRLLRDVQPELMDALIHASKDGDTTKLQSLAGEKNRTVEENEEDGEETDSDEEVSAEYVEVAARWFDGLIDRDSSITSEVYSIHTVEYDRQDLRKLVRRVHLTQEAHNVEESGEVVDSTASKFARKSLIRFLQRLAQQTLSVEEA